MFLLNFQKKGVSEVFRFSCVTMAEVDECIIFFFIQVQLLIHSIAQIFVIVFSNKQFLNRCLSSVFP